MDVLVCCEESQRVCIAFREKGHNAYSCDLQYCSGGYPGWHIVSDCLDLINGYVSFVTQDGSNYILDKRWDLIIAHPPCTYLSKAGATSLFNNRHEIIDYDRLKKGFDAVDLFKRILNADCDKICIENPTPLSIFNLPRHTQVIQPFEFGSFAKKRTLLWLKNLPYLMPTDLCVPVFSYTCKVRNPKDRAKTFPGIALAMAEQWG